MRIHELAKELGVTSKELIAALEAFGPAAEPAPDAALPPPAASPRCAVGGWCVQERGRARHPAWCGAIGHEAQMVGRRARLQELVLNQSGDVAQGAIHRPLRHRRCPPFPSTEQQPSRKITN